MTGRSLLFVWAISAAVVIAQESPTTPKASRIRILEGPQVQLSKDFLTIIMWKVDNPGSPVHYGIVRYGTDPKNLNQIAKNPIRLNPYHPTTVFRVRMDNLKTRTTYYYTVESEEATGTSDRVKSAVKQFTTPGGTATSGPVK